jgi:hypothetical protein
MTSIWQFDQHAGQIIEGQFHLSEVKPCFGPYKNRLVLEDYSGTASVVLNSVGTGLFKGIAEDLPENSTIQAQLVPKAMDIMMGGTLLEASPLELHELWNAAAVIPMSAVPKKAHTALADLTQLIDHLTVLPVKHCVNQIIAKNWRGLVKSQAGWKYHHAFAGGLLVHTVSVMKRVNSVGGTTFMGDRPRVELMILAALIHDLGKSIQIDKTIYNPAIKHLRHELLNLPLCLDELNQLGRDWHQGAIHLSQTLNWLCSGTEERRRNHSIDGEFVHMMDVIDVWQDRAPNQRLWGT